MEIWRMAELWNKTKEQVAMIEKDCGGVAFMIYRTYVLKDSPVSKNSAFNFTGLVALWNVYFLTLLERLPQGRRNRCTYAFLVYLILMQDL